MTTIFTLLSGGEGVGVGARAAGLVHIGGIEIDDAVAGVARINGFDVTTANLLDIDPTALPVPDILHASPSCKNASVANQNALINEDGTKETPDDMAIGEKIAQFIDVMKPQIFTLENVYAYRKFKAFKVICDALDRNGYIYDYSNVNAADFGVPQTRRRLILRAVLGRLLPPLPSPERHIGWYEAIEDLIPELPESQLAGWQKKRLSGKVLDKCILVDQINYNCGNPTTRLPKSPIWTISIYDSKHQPPRAIPVDGQHADYNNDTPGVTVANSYEPSFTVTSTKADRQTVSAIMVSDQSHSQGEGCQVLDGDSPAAPIRAGDKGGAYPKIITPYRVVSLSPRALARLQSFPDSYILPDNRRLACKVIGNAVPPLLYQKIVAGLVAGMVAEIGA